jgi:HSP20 family molecular chaperone IbpA
MEDTSELLGYKINSEFKTVFHGPPLRFQRINRYTMSILRRGLVMGRNFWVGPLRFEPSHWTAGAITPQVDVEEDDLGVQIYVELAGVKEQDIQLAIDNGVLTVFGEKHPQNSKRSGNAIVT